MICHHLHKLYPDLLLELGTDHHHHITLILEKLRENQLVEKCEFYLPSTHFLIYINSQVGIQMDQGKMQAVQSCPQHNPQQRPPMFSRICTFLSFHSQLQYYSHPSHFITKIQAQVSALEHPVLHFNASSPASPLHPFSSILTLS